MLEQQVSLIYEIACCSSAIDIVFDLCHRCADAADATAVSAHHPVLHGGGAGGNQRLQCLHHEPGDHGVAAWAGA